MVWTVRGRRNVVICWRRRQIVACQLGFKIAPLKLKSPPLVVFSCLIRAHMCAAPVRELRVNEPEGVLHAVAQGNARRISAGRTTEGHRCTSRAHAILTLNMMQRRDAEPGAVPHMIHSKLQFVDLAGGSFPSVLTPKVYHTLPPPSLLAYVVTGIWD